MNISKEYVQNKNTEKFSDHHEDHQDVATLVPTLGVVQHTSK